MQQTDFGKYRWTICSLIFFATTINYLDRAVISLLKSSLSVEFKWNDGDYANIEIAFKVSYALGMVGAGRLIDKLGTKIGYFLSTLLWSIAAVAHAFSNSTFGFGVARSALGITEAGNFPAAIKTVAEWFPKKERALATGIFNSGTNVGAIIAPLTVPWINVHWGWQWAFILTGSLGFIWLIFWWVIYEVPARHKKLSQNEFEYIHSDSLQIEVIEKVPAENISWIRLMGYRQTWAAIFGKFLTDPIWWFYLFWLPDFLESEYHLKGIAIGLPVAMVYTLSTLGSIGGGWLPLQLIKRNVSLFRARKVSMLIYAFCVLPIVFAQLLGSLNMWLAVIVIGFAAAAHQAWSANMYTVVSDRFPKKVVGSVIGIAGMFGAIGGIVLSLFVQKTLFVHYRALNQIETAYYIMFFISGTAYILAWVIMQALLGKKEEVVFN
jgi:ACS family hexuronate transporter-like MFS transporter